MFPNSVLTLAFLPLSLAHFQLKFPASRGFTDDTESNFPCGGFDDVQQQRTDFPIGGGPIQLHMEHPQTNVAVYMAIGDNPGDGFSIVAQQQLQVSGLGDFCLGSVAVPAGLNVSDGTKASIQVVTNSHEAGGLYQCADVTLVNNAQINLNDNCKNQTGMSVTQENISGNPNGTSTEASPSSATSGGAAGKGTPRRKVKKVHRAAGTDDKKLQTALKKLNVQPIQAIEEVNMFKSDGNVIHFSAPKVHASVPANTFAIYGHGEDKELTELVPGILNQLGPDSLASLRKLAESYQSMQKEKGEDGEKKDDEDEDDDDIPDLVAGENFESKAEVE
ncbi:hypothetical protein G6011_07213 [Alternaria panax]|uniref:Nascent polypeptide-associated complex subunit beta n=1 Tax=Alternaria panax TaxID=48097 RepID=A0AAD4F9X4_9PLEO|nr:hypothetical protein G6011_07213 [Alternaria panax]